MKLTPGQKYAIVNADDFGFSPLTTEGILHAHKQGIVTSTTLAANMPSASGAVHRLKEAPGLGVGVHLNCTQGPAMSYLGREMLCGPDGVMNYTATGIIVACAKSPSLLKAIEAEFDAQIRWAMENGVRPTHLDSHRHSHAFLPIFCRVMKLAKRYHVPFIRRHREVLPGHGWPVAPAKQRRTSWFLNCLGRANRLVGRRFLATGGTWGVRHTGMIDAAWMAQAASRLPAGVTEIMTHPGIDGDLDASVTRLRQSRQMELSAVCDGAVKAAFADNNIRLIHYGQL